MQLITRTIETVTTTRKNTEEAAEVTLLMMLLVVGAIVGGCILDGVLGELVGTCIRVVPTVADVEELTNVEELLNTASTLEAKPSDASVLATSETNSIAEFDSVSSRSPTASKVTTHMYGYELSCRCLGSWRSILLSSPSLSCSSNVIKDKDDESFKRRRADGNDEIAKLRIL